MNLDPSEIAIKKFLEEGLLIRSATDSDLEKITQLKYRIFQELCPRLVQWYNKHPEAFQTEFYGPKKQNPQLRVFYCVETSQKNIVGCGGLTQKEPDKEPKTAEFTDIYLSPEYRGKGLGKTITRDLIKKARELDFQSIFLTTRIEFKAAIGLYKKLGFTQIKNTKYISNNSIALELLLKD